MYLHIIQIYNFRTCLLMGSKLNSPEMYWSISAGTKSSYYSHNFSKKTKFAIKMFVFWMILAKNIKLGNRLQHVWYMYAYCTYMYTCI